MLLRKSLFTGNILAILLTIFSISGCGLPADELPTNEGANHIPLLESDNITVQEFIPFLGDVREDFQFLVNCVDQADIACKNLENFKWEGLDNLGYYIIEEKGYCCMEPILCDKTEQPSLYSPKIRWESVLTRLPTKERLKPVRLLIDSCKDTLVNLDPNAILRQINGGHTENSEYYKTQWDTSLNNLDANLKSAIHQVRINRFNGTGFMNKSNSLARTKYEDKFNNQFQKYSDLIDTLILKLQEASEAVIRLKDKEGKL